MNMSLSKLWELVMDREASRAAVHADTLARDCVWFRELGYEIGAVTPVDMFPRTGHVESVICLTRR